MEGNIVYVGRTHNIVKRFLQHDHLTDNIKKIEYIECATEADMCWKEIYYINLFANDKTTNVSDLYEGGVTDIHIKDTWKLYRAKNFTDYFDEQKISKNYSLLSNPDLISKIHLIHIFENEKLNAIGSQEYDLSRKWFYDSKTQNNVTTLKNHLLNYFTNICNAKTSECLWTTFDETVIFLKGKGYARAYISLNSQNINLENNHRENRRYLAYACNNFYSTIKTPIAGVDEDGYALSEMLQFIWRSAIRDGKEIWLYIPSIRMRTLLKQWIKSNSNGE